MNRFLTTRNSIRQLGSLLTRRTSHAQSSIRLLKHVSWPCQTIGSCSIPGSLTTRAYSNESSSIDEREIENFRRMSQSWWIENGKYEALHRMNELRVPWIRDTMINYRKTFYEIDAKSPTNDSTNNEERDIFNDDELRREPLSGLRILDVGCGGGILTEPLARLGAQMTGIDACKENIQIAQLRLSNETEKTNQSSRYLDRITYLNCTLEDLSGVSDNENYFDAIVMSEVVEHVNNVEQFISNSAKLLKNHGFSFLTTLNRTSQSYWLGIVAAENLLNLVPKGTHEWDKFIKPQELKNYLEENHVFVKFQMGMMYNPVTKVWSWNDSECLNYAMYAQKNNYLS